MKVVFVTLVGPRKLALYKSFCGYLKLKVLYIKMVVEIKKVIRFRKQCPGRSIDENLCCQKD